MALSFGAVRRACFYARMNVPMKLLSLKLVQVGNSTGLVLPKDVLARLVVAAGDTLNASIDDVAVTISGPMTTAKHRWPSRAT
jgi:antitoxin component of MazEF toxin-antitoxin module